MLLNLTLITVALVVLALVGFLTPTAIALHRARKSVAAIADGLEAVSGHTAPLAQKLGDINGGMSAVSSGLQQADRHLGAAAIVFKLDV